MCLQKDVGKGLSLAKLVVFHKNNKEAYLFKTFFKN